jgi:hypothetical protein
MTLEQAEGIVDYMDRELGVEAVVRETYSGRGMFGKSVPAIVTDNIIAVGYAAAALDVPYQDCPRRTDSMGTSLVVY